MKRYWKFGHKKTKPFCGIVEGLCFGVGAQSEVEGAGFPFQLVPGNNSDTG